MRYRASNGDIKPWLHAIAIDFLADLVQHIPKARQQTVSYHGWFANATARADLYALLLPQSGRAAFPGETPMAVMQAQLEGGWSRLEVLRV